MISLTRRLRGNGTELSEHLFRFRVVKQHGWVDRLVHRVESIDAEERLAIAMNPQFAAALTPVPLNGTGRVPRIERRKSNGRRTICSQDFRKQPILCPRPRQRSASKSPNDEAAAASISELIDLSVRKKAEIERLTELERERMQLL